MHFFKSLPCFLAVIACSLTLNVHAEVYTPCPVDIGQPARGARVLDHDQDGEISRMTNPRAVHKLTEIPAAKSRASTEIFPKQIMEVSTGTAWPVAFGYVVTNNHVIEGCREVVLRNVDGREIHAWPVLRDEAYDIALLRVVDAHQLPPALPLAESDAVQGTDVFTVGFPRADVLGKTPKCSEGVISRIEGPNGDPASYQTTVSIQPGNSGGPLLNMRGEVVGVVRSMLGIRDEARGGILMLQNASCAVKIDFVKELLAYLPKKAPIKDALPSHLGSLEKLTHRIKGSVLLVEAR